MFSFARWTAVIGLGLMVAGTGSVSAQVAPPAIPDISAVQLSAFKTDPIAFLRGIEAAKGDIAATIAGIIVKDPGALTTAQPGTPSQIASASRAFPDQSKAFVKGIADAARSFVDSKQRELFTAVQTAVVSQFDSGFQADFTSAIADIRTASLGVSSGAGGGAINGLQSSGANSGAFNFASESVRNNGPGTPQVGVSSLSSSSGGTGTNTSTNTTTTTLITRTVNSSSSTASLNSF